MVREKNKDICLLFLQYVPLQRRMRISMFSTCSMNYSEGIYFKCFIKIKRENSYINAYLCHSSRESKRAKKTQGPFPKGRKMSV